MLHWRGLTWGLPRMLSKAGARSLTTGSSWSSDNSFLTNSEMTLIAPCTESALPDKSLTRSSSNVG